MARSLCFFVVPVIAGDGEPQRFGTWFRCPSIESAAEVAQGLSDRFPGAAIFKGYDPPADEDAPGRSEAPCEFVAKFGEVPNRLLLGLKIEG